MSEKLKVCTRCRKAPRRGPRALYCDRCKARTLREQRADAHLAWLKRVRTGDAKHRLTYGGKPTAWAKLRK